MNTETQNFLSGVRVYSLLGKKASQELVTITESTTIEEALEVLCKHKILSVPVTGSGGIVGILDVYEIMSYTTFATEPVDWKKPASDLLGTMGNLVDDEVCGVWVVKESDSLHKPLEWLSKGVHRFIVQTTSGPKILSQSDLVKFLLSAYDKFNLGNITIQEAKITHKPVTHVENPTSALDTLKKTRIYEVHGIAITDANGTLVGTLSESDLRGLKMDSLDKLNLPVLEYLKNQNNGQVPEVVKVKVEDSLQSLLETVAAKNIHRVFVVDNSDHLIGVITLTDIIEFFWNTTMELWLAEKP